MRYSQGTTHRYWEEEAVRMLAGEIHYLTGSHDHDRNWQEAERILERLEASMAIKIRGDAQDEAMRHSSNGLYGI
jgi:hypothetical protein